MTDIVEVLTPPNSFSDTATAIVSAGEMRDAVAEITSLRAENERLREALKEAKKVLAPLATRFLYPDDIGADYTADLRADDDWDEAANEATVDDVWIARGDIRRARAALTAQPAPSPWRPIETAPKDGSRLLLAYQNSHQKWRRVIAFYAPKLSVEANDDGSDWCEYDEATGRYFLPEGWYECIDNWDDYSYVHIGENTPSHWMPLPPAPKEEE